MKVLCKRHWGLLFAWMTAGLVNELSPFSVFEVYVLVALTKVKYTRMYFKEVRTVHWFHFSLRSSN